MKLHHLAVATPDPEGLAAFYAQILELQPLTTHHDAAGLRSVWLKAGEVIVMFERCATPQAALRPGANKRPGLHLLAFAISGAERTAALCKLRAQGVRVADESAYSIYFFDPEGNRVALSHYPDVASGPS